MIQHQHWEDSIRILVTDEQHYGSIQVYIPHRAEYRPLDGEADALIYSLWVGERHRGREVAKHLMEIAERELKRCGIATVAISWDGRDSPRECCNGIKGWATKKRRSTIDAARSSNGCNPKKLIPKAKGPYLVCRMSPLRPTYLTGSGADKREEGKLIPLHIFLINGFIE